MKTFKLLGIGLFIGLLVSHIYEYHYDDNSIVNQAEVGLVKVETVYYEIGKPSVTYKEGDVHPAEWLYPTGQMHGVFPIGSAQEREYMEYKNKQTRKTYKPSYKLEPVETGQ